MLSSPKEFGINGLITKDSKNIPFDPLLPEVELVRECLPVLGCPRLRQRFTQPNVAFYRTDGSSGAVG
jgi:hypothetical protein